MAREKIIVGSAKARPKNVNQPLRLKMSAPTANERSDRQDPGDDSERSLIRALIRAFNHELDAPCPP
jgi:hypothetical protein